MRIIRKLQQLSLLSIFILSMSFLYAASKVEKVEKEDDKLPLGCRDIGYEFELNILTLLPEEAGERQSLYFIYNKLNTAVNVYQMLKDDSTRSMYLNHVIRPKQWAVLSTSESKLKYICTIDDAKLSYGKIVDCGESLRVCEYARVKYGMNNKGNYWVVNSNTKGGAVREVLNYGIIPR